MTKVDAVQSLWISSSCQIGARYTHSLLAIFFQHFQKYNSEHGHLTENPCFLLGHNIQRIENFDC